MTKKIIRKEAGKQFRGYFLGMVLLLPFYALLCFILAFFIALLINVVVQNKMTLNIIVVVLLSLMSIPYIYVVINTICGFVSFMKGETEIIDDWLVDKLPKRHGRYTHRPNTLVFARSGEFGLSDDFYYKWSKIYSMTEESVYDRSALDDDFYVINIGKTKKVMAYNKKWFELKEI